MNLSEDAAATCLGSACDAVRDRARCAGLSEADAEECAAEYRKRKLRSRPLEELNRQPDANCNRVCREANWFVNTWIRDRTESIAPTEGAETETGAIHNIGLDTIAEIVKTLTPSQQWIWRRAEIEGALLQDLAAEIGWTTNELNRALEGVKRRIRWERKSREEGRGDWGN